MRKASECIKLHGYCQRNSCSDHLVFQNEAMNILWQDFVMMNISCEFGGVAKFLAESKKNKLPGVAKLLAEREKKMPVAAILFFRMRPKIFPGKILG